MSQLQLFRPERTEPVRRPPDLIFIRKSLNRDLRLVREAEIMPWSDSEAASRERQFPQLAALLPADEAKALTASFRYELMRLWAAR